MSFISDIVKLIDGSGATVVEYTYDSWGKPLSTTSTLASSLGSNNPFRYRGYVYDTETTLYYLQSRYYNPAMGRFISSDVYLSTGQGVLGNNTFAYCNNNPIKFKDPSGCIIVLADTATEEQRAQYEAAIAYLSASSTFVSLLATLTDSTEIFTINFTNDLSTVNYQPGTRTINWDPTAGLLLKDETSTISASIALAHEMGHGA